MAVLTRFLLFLEVLAFTDSSLSRFVLVRDGEEAALTCPNVEPGQTQCRRTTWVLSLADGSRSVELITLGQIGSGVSELSDLSKRLSLTGQCGLRIQHVHPQEAGVFSCEQYTSSEGKPNSESSVHLAVVSLTEAETDVQMLRCAVYSPIRVTVRWLYKNRVIDKNNEELQETPLQGGAVLTFLKEHFLHEEKHLLKCEVKYGNKSEEFNFKPENSKTPDQTNTNPKAPPDNEDRNASGLKDWHWAAVAVALVLVVLVVVLIFWRRLRAKPRGPNTVPPVRHTVPQTEPDDEVSYATFSYNRNQRPEVRQSEEAVTYSSVRIKVSEHEHATVHKPKPAN